jgi:hypothetical protein
MGAAAGESWSQSKLEKMEKNMMKEKGNVGDFNMRSE